MSRGCQRHKMQKKICELRIDSEKATSLTIKPQFSFTHDLTGGSFPLACVRARWDGRHISPSHLQWGSWISILCRYRNWCNCTKLTLLQGCVEKHCLHELCKSDHRCVTVENTDLHKKQDQEIQGQSAQIPTQKTPITIEYNQKIVFN